jgi:5,10-methylene-tetrahydrofolate dehydrogenase/methenyl tetrahydrofolate cyclohydrolase
MKIKAAEEVGILYKHITLSIEATVDEIVDVVEKLNGNDTVSGIIVQLPLGDHIGPDEERTVIEAVSPEKDVDGYAQPCPIAARTHVMCGDQIPCVQHRPPIFSCRLAFVHTVHAHRRPAPA